MALVARISRTGFSRFRPARRRRRQRDDRGHALPFDLHRRQRCRADAAFRRPPNRARSIRARRQRRRYVRIPRLSQGRRLHDPVRDPAQRQRTREVRRPHARRAAVRSAARPSSGLCRSRAAGPDRSQSRYAGFLMPNRRHHRALPARYRKLRPLDEFRTRQRTRRPRRRHVRRARLGRLLDASRARRRAPNRKRDLSAGLLFGAQRHTQIRVRRRRRRRRARLDPNRDRSGRTRPASRCENARKRGQRAANVPKLSSRS